MRLTKKKDLVTIEELENTIHSITKLLFRIDITIEYKDKKICVDFYYGIIFTSDGTNVQDISHSVLNQIKNYDFSNHRLLLEYRNH